MENNESDENTNNIIYNNKKTDEFIMKAKKVHGDKYDYSNAIYEKANIKIKILCSIHGEFEQSPNNHLLGKGCRLCGYKSMSNILKLSNSEFITKASNLHNNIYDYSKVNFINNSEKIKIICKIHGEFEQRPLGHLSGKGCKLCAILVNSNNKKKTNEEFINQANKIHGKIYN